MQVNRFRLTCRYIDTSGETMMQVDLTCRCVELSTQAFLLGSNNSLPSGAAFSPRANALAKGRRANGEPAKNLQRASGEMHGHVKQARDGVW